MLGRPPRRLQLSFLIPSSCSVHSGPLNFRVPAPSNHASVVPNLSAVLHVSLGGHLETAVRVAPLAFSFLPKHKTGWTLSMLTFGPRPALVWDSQLNTTRQDAS